MNSLTEYMRRPGKACQLPVLVDGELSRNEREVNAAVELSDAEEFVKVRVLLVSDGHFDLLRSAIEDLKNAGDVCSSDGCRHDYLLCTLSGLFKLSANNTEAGETFKFSL